MGAGNFEFPLMFLGEVLCAAILDVVFEQQLGIDNFTAIVLATEPFIFCAAGFLQLSAKVFG